MIIYTIGIKMIFNKKYFISFNKGFTTVELLVALMVFSILLSFGLGIFVSITKNQRRVLVKQDGIFLKWANSGQSYSPRRN